MSELFSCSITPPRRRRNNAGRFSLFKSVYIIFFALRTVNALQKKLTANFFHKNISLNRPYAL
ncbi:MAG TPA: hypothetical protein VJ720_15785, partial [Chitinophaga sp.]|nr:hypothetical protein [Chitinophaga sp.]